MAPRAPTRRPLDLPARAQPGRYALLVTILLTERPVSPDAGEQARHLRSLLGRALPPPALTPPGHPRTLHRPVTSVRSCVPAHAVRPEMPPSQSSPVPIVQWASASATVAYTAVADLTTTVCSLIHAGAWVVARCTSDGLSTSRKGAASCR